MSAKKAMQPIIRTNNVRQIPVLDVEVIKPQPIKGAANMIDRNNQPKPVAPVVKQLPAAPTTVSEVKGGKKQQISRQEFKRDAKAVLITVDKTPMFAEAKEFSTGSFGFNSCGKVVLNIGGKNITLQANIILTVVGSKESE